MERPVNYEQTDARWRNIMYSSRGDKNQTIGTSGCGPTCAAMVISEIKGYPVYPTDCCKWSEKHGYRTDNNGTSWSYFVPQFAAYDIQCNGYTGDVNAALSALKDGKMVIALATKGLWTSSGHFILAYCVKGNKVYINDPNSTNKAKEEADINIFRQQCRKFWIVEENWMVKKLEQKVDIDGKTSLLSAVNVDGENYFRVRDIAPVLGYQVDWDASRKVVVLKKK